jgi:hypothetical protein
MASAGFYNLIFNSIARVFYPMSIESDHDALDTGQERDKSRDEKRQPKVGQEQRMEEHTLFKAFARRLFTPLYLALYA